MKKYILLLFTLFLISCGSEEQDIKEAEKITQNFYNFLKQHNKEEAFKLFNQNTTDKEKFYLIYDRVENENGSIKDYKLIEWQKSISAGTNSKAAYLLTYNVSRDISNTKEFFLLQKIDDTIRIIKTKIDFDLLPKK